MDKSVLRTKEASATEFTLHQKLPREYQRKIRVISAIEDKTINEVLKQMIDRASLEKGF